MHPPVVTGRDTRRALLNRAVRPSVPLRKTFVQAERGTTPRHGPLHQFLSGGDVRGLRAYLIVVASASAENDDGWSTTLDSLVFARLFDTTDHATPASARTGAWRTLQRLEARGLLTCTRERGSRKIKVTLLREDGSGRPYTRPDGKDLEDRFINLPTRFWNEGHDEKLDIPAFAMLLAVARDKPWSSFPAEHMPEWYGWSADTTLRGLQKIVDLGLVERRVNFRPATLTAAVGFTKFYQYRLVGWMRPKPRKMPAEAAGAELSSSPTKVPPEHVGRTGPRRVKKS